jgi:hypothetical protein
MTNFLQVWILNIKTIIVKFLVSSFSPQQNLLQLYQTLSIVRLVYCIEFELILHVWLFQVSNWPKTRVFY